MHLFCQIASNLFEYCWSLWKTDVQKILQGLSGASQCLPANSLVLQQDNLLLICERWLLCSKIIRQLIISGYPSDSTSLEVNVKVYEVVSFHHLLGYAIFMAIIFN